MGWRTADDGCWRSAPTVRPSSCSVSDWPLVLVMHEIHPLTLACYGAQMTTRRDFIVTGATIASAVAASRALGQPIEIEQPPNPAPQGTAFAEELALEALNAAKSAGASYADARVGRYRRQQISTRDRSISGVSDSESFGVGVRTLVNGSWGFAATSEVTKDGVAKAAREAARLARAARTVQRRPVE